MNDLEFSCTEWFLGTDGKFENTWKLFIPHFQTKWIRANYADVVCSDGFTIPRKCEAYVRNMNGELIVIKKSQNWNEEIENRS